MLVLHGWCVVALNPVLVVDSLQVERLGRCERRGTDDAETTVDARGVTCFPKSDDN